MIKKIEIPDLSAIDANKSAEFLKDADVRLLVNKSFTPYSPWEKIKYWSLPKGVSPLELWAAISLVRREAMPHRVSPVLSESGQRFSYLSWLPELEQFLHQVDMKLGGNLAVFGTHVDERMRHYLLSRGIMEEAIASSQLEGAHSTRKAAKQLLLEQRKPSNKDERMIVNNYQAMRFIEDEFKNRQLDEKSLLHLHEILTVGTLEKSDVGRYRKDNDEIVVGSNVKEEEIYHVPPKELFIKKEIKRLIDYANDSLHEPAFVHPVIKAIILHFWIGYLHPFVDGNGRLARAIFYWYLLRKGYWAFGYLPLSKVIKNSPGQYRDAYIYSEQDNCDLTYFIDYNIRKINQALQEFELYAQNKWQENATMAKLARTKYEFNDRQIQLLRYFYKNKDASTSLTTHMKIHETARMTAAQDLKGLLKKGFVITKKVGRIVYYYPTDKVSAMFRDKG